MAKKVNAKAFVAFLQERVKKKDGYLMSAVGEYTKKLTSGSWQITQYKGNSSQHNKALYWLKNAERCWDCNGLAEGYYKDMTGTSINTRARNNYSEWCNPKGTGSIPAKHKVPGAAVFTYSSSSGAITHVGFLEKPVDANKPTGDWYVIEARGVMYGVDGDFGNDTEKALKQFQKDKGLTVSGQCDEATWAALGVLSTIIVTGGTVNVRSKAGTDGAILGTVKQGDKLQTRGAAKDGWVPVRYKDKDAWISAKYTK